MKRSVARELRMRLGAAGLLPAGGLLVFVIFDIDRIFDARYQLSGGLAYEIADHVILPLARPGILTVGIFSFIIGWTDYLFALIMIRSEELKTLPVGLSTLYGKFDSSWSEIMAGAVLVSIPAIVLVAATARHFVGGLSLGATKG